MLGILQQFLRSISTADDEPSQQSRSQPIQPDIIQIPSKQSDKTDAVLKPVPTLYKAKSDDTGSRSMQSLNKEANSLPIATETPIYRHHPLPKIQPSHRDSDSYTNSPEYVLLSHAPSKATMQTESTTFTWRFPSDATDTTHTTSSYPKEGVMHATLDHIENHYKSDKTTSPYFTISLQPSSSHRTPNLSSHVGSQPISHLTPSNSNEARSQRYDRASLDPEQSFRRISPTSAAAAAAGIIQLPDHQLTSQMPLISLPQHDDVHTVDATLMHSTHEKGSCHDDSVEPSSLSLSMSSSASIDSSLSTVSAIPPSIANEDYHEQSDFLMYLLTDQRIATRYCPGENIDPLNTIFKRIRAIYYHHGGVSAVFRAIHLLLAHTIGNLASATGEYLWFYDAVDEKVVEKQPAFQTEKERLMWLFEKHCHDSLVSPKSPPKPALQPPKGPSKWMKILILCCGALTIYELALVIFVPTSSLSIVHRLSTLFLATQMIPAIKVGAEQGARITYHVIAAVPCTLNTIKRRLHPLWDYLTSFLVSITRNVFHQLSACAASIEYHKVLEKLRQWSRTIINFLLFLITASIEFGGSIISSVINRAT